MVQAAIEQLGEQTMSFMKWLSYLVFGGCAAPGAFDGPEFADEAYEGADAGVFGDEEGMEAEDDEVGGSSEALTFAAYYGGSALTGVRKVARGGKTNCALTYDGYVYCWGDWNGSRRMPFRPRPRRGSLP